jgi:hypothetical protein
MRVDLRSQAGASALVSKRKGRVGIRKPNRTNVNTRSIFASSFLCKFFYVYDGWSLGYVVPHSAYPVGPPLSDVHDVFHVSQLKKCLRVLEEQVLMEAMDLQSYL